MEGLRLVGRPKVGKNGERLVKPRYVWPCRNCSGIVDVSRQTFEGLKNGRVAGVFCQGCLNPPPQEAAKAA